MTTTRELLFTEPVGYAECTCSYCSGCGAYIQFDVFPALLKGTARGQRAEGIILDDESSCFFHPTKKAAVACEGCGRFLCSLCDIEFDGRHLCPACIESGEKKGKMEKLQNRVVRYDSISLAVAIIPMLIFYITLITAPVALYLAIRHWNDPMGILPRTRVRFVLAIIIAGLQVTGWGIGAVVLFERLLG